MHKKYKAFTLVELMVAMAIIAVLIGLSVFGIATAQRVLRDNQRRDAVKNIAAALNSVYSTTSTYPATISSTSGSSGASITIGSIVVPTAGILRVAASTGAGQTKYCYAFAATGTGYQLAAVLEDGTVFNLGSSSTALTAACTAIT